jgi:protein-S-isoprenylcysteine O-methyltransferase Ste14
MLSRVILAIVLIPVLVWGFFSLAGRWDWIRGWGFVVVVVLGNTTNDLYVWRKNPEVLLARARFGEGTKTWDKVCLPLFGVLYVVIVVVGALDGGRYSWSAMPGWLWPIGAILYILSLAVLGWSMAVNPHFEKTARIQTDRGHQVVDSGPYQFVRHPGYLAVIAGYISGTPLMLGSWWAFVPAALAATAMVIRTALEDRMLLAELAGYAGYASRVRHRLIPGVW